MNKEWYHEKIQGISLSIAIQSYHRHIHKKRAPKFDTHGPFRIVEPDIPKPNENERISDYVKVWMIEIPVFLSEFIPLVMPESIGNKIDTRVDN